MITTVQSRLKDLARYPIPLTINELNALNNGTKVLINSLPKSGTFLLRRTLSLLPGFVPRWSKHGLAADKPNLNQMIQQIRRGQYVSGHLYWSPEMVDLLISKNIRTVFIIRDLRDVAVSLAFYLNQKKSNHVQHEYFASLPSDHERIMAAILGAEQQLYYDCPGKKSIGEFSMAFFPWLKEPNCLAVRFEDLIGTAGGGSDEKQKESLQKIIDHLEIDLSKSEIDRVANSLFYRKTHTFRKGTIGDWKNWFTAEHKQAFKDVAGEALIKFGYETGYDW